MNLIPMFKVSTSARVIPDLEETFKSGMIGEGPKVLEFKNALESKFNCKNLIPLNSGTSALILALRLAGVEGGEVITTPFTMIATNVAIRAAGATPVFADINSNNVNISPKSVAKCITPKTKAIIAVNVAGVPCDFEELNKFGLPVISDAAHAILTTYKGRHISHWADYTMFSFQSIKQLNTGDGGALIIKNNKKYELGQKLKWFGMSREVPEGMTRLEHQMTADVEDWGYKFHMNDITATIGLANLKDLDAINSRQRKNAEYFRTNLKRVGGLPVVPEDSNPSWWAFYLCVENRKEFMKKMADAGIETTPMWRRNDEYSCFNKGKYKELLPNMNEWQDRVIFIPVGWWLSDLERTHIYESIIRILTS